MPTQPRRTVLLTAFLLLARGVAMSWAADQPQWGQKGTRNMVSSETGLPDSFDPKTGKNVKWSAALGTQCYSTPVVAGGKVLIGTNNGQPRDPRHRGDRGVLMCFNEADGSLAWQLVVPKLEGDIYLDWPEAGICSTATIEGDRVYTVTNRDELVCLDLQGMSNGNDGPFRDEGRHMSPPDESPMEIGPKDADIIWLLDLRSAAGVRPHDSCEASILIDGPNLYLNTNNGLNSKHNAVEKREAPCLIIVDKATGKLLAREREGIASRTFHSTWSSPAVGDVGGRRLIFFGGGDGVCYAFEPIKTSVVTDAGRSHAELPESETASLATAGSIGSLRCVWRFDCDPTAPKKAIHRYIGNHRESPSDIKGMPVFHDGRVYVTFGGDIWWGKNQAWLQCIDAGKSGDITAGGGLWSYAVEHHCCSTPSIQDGLVYVADCGGKVHCVDAETGRPYWVHEARGEIWASTLVADGKVFTGTRKGDFWILAAGKEKRVLSSVHLEDGVISTAVAANGTLYVGTMTRLYALQEGARSRKSAD